MVLSSQGPRVREEEEQQSIYRKWRRNRWTVHNCGGKLTRKENRKRELANPLQLQATKRTLKWTNKYLREGRIPPFRTFLMFSGSWKRKVKRSPNGQVGVSVLGPRTKAGMRIFPCRNQRRNNWRGKKKKVLKIIDISCATVPWKMCAPSTILNWQQYNWKWWLMKERWLEWGWCDNQHFLAYLRRMRR